MQRKITRREFITIGLRSLAALTIVGNLPLNFKPLVSFLFDKKKYFTIPVKPFYTKDIYSNHNLAG